MNSTKSNNNHSNNSTIVTITSLALPISSNNHHKHTAKKVKLDALSGDFLRSIDSKGGFLLESTLDDSNNSNDTQNNKAHQKHQLNNEISFGDPPINFNLEDNPKCLECKSLEIDYTFQKYFKIHVCKLCREKHPEKYSLLTKTECREDYLLTNSELQDHNLFPAWIKPNPHKSSWSDMYLYLRCQVEEFAWKKWGSPKNLDVEYEKREKEKKTKKEKKYKEKMKELRKKTRTSQSLQKRQLHIHQFGDKKFVEDKNCFEQTCLECGISVEFDEF